MTYNTGESGIYGIPQRRLVFSRARGWILSESEVEILILEDNLWTERRLRRRDLPERWEEFKDTVPAGDPRPGEYALLEFEDYCTRFLGLGSDEYCSWFDFTRDETECSLARGARACLLAYWALQRRRPRLALRLVENARASFEGAAKQSGSTMAPAPTLAGQLATALRWQAQTLANTGAPRSELVEKWKLLLRLPENEWTGEAKEMIAAYKAMIEEDRDWKSLSTEELVRLDASAQAEYWLHELRDLKAKQWSQPGSCIVSGPLAGIPEGVINPVDKLIELGWDAIPQVIAHLDDRRPTRSLGWCRSHWPSTYWMLRTGDCCVVVFWKVTGVGLYAPTTTSGYMVLDGKASEAKAAAEAWWKEHGAEGREAYLAGVIEKGPPGCQSGAAYRLLKMDAEKYLSQVLKVAEKKDNAARGALLGELRPYLGRQHANFLAGFLADEDLETVVLAAGMLWDKCGSSEGAARVIELVDATPMDKAMGGFEFEDALAVVARTGTDASVDAFLRWMKSPDRWRRAQAIQHAGSLRNPRIGEALASYLNDTWGTGATSGGGEIRYCDYAAYALGWMLLRETWFDWGRPRSERDVDIAELKAWWDAHSESIDWADLRAKASKPTKAR